MNGLIFKGAEMKSEEITKFLDSLTPIELVYLHIQVKNRLGSEKDEPGYINRLEKENIGLRLQQTFYIEGAQAAAAAVIDQATSEIEQLKKRIEECEQIKKANT